MQASNLYVYITAKDRYEEVSDEFDGYTNSREVKAGEVIGVIRFNGYTTCDFFYGRLDRYISSTTPHYIKVPLKECTFNSKEESFFFKGKCIACKSYSIQIDDRFNIFEDNRITVISDAEGKAIDAVLCTL